MVGRVLVVAAWAIGAGLSASFAGAAAAEVERLLENLLSRVGVENRYLHADPAIVAGVGMLVLAFGCCVEGIAGRRYSVLVHSASPFLWAVPPGSLDPPAGASYVVNSRMVSHLTLLCNCFGLTISASTFKMHLHR